MFINCSVFFCLFCRYSPAEGEKQFKKLKAWLESDQVIPDVQDYSSLKWSVAQYHPPFTLPFLRRNEIWIQLDEENEKVKEMMKEKEVEVDKSL